MDVPKRSKNKKRDKRHHNRNPEERQSVVNKPARDKRWKDKYVAGEYEEEDTFFDDNEDFYFGDDEDEDTPEK